ncbi:MAG: PfkB family carbohydrate kinase [Chloroflexota bacterium]|nr:PfkB family carbohydrate kinase [Chloroflexota bacterium]
MLLIPEYLVVGHVTWDVGADGALRPGGTATYSALTAHRLGLKTAVLTSADPEYPLFARAPSIALHRLPAQRTTTFENTYLAQGRRQYIRALATPLAREDVPEAWERAVIVHLGPVAREVDVRLVEAFSPSLLGLTLQGWLRRWDGDGLVSYAAWDGARRGLHVADVVVLSLEDLEGDARRLAPYASETDHLVLTQGREGATVYYRGHVVHMPAYKVREVDSTGAGDVFATAYFVRFFETQDVRESLRFANAAASFIVETVGARGMPSREQIAWRLGHGRLRE